MRTFSLVAALAAAALLAPSAHAASTLAKVDTKRLFEQYRDAQSSQSKFKKRAEALQNELRTKAESYQREFNEKNRLLQEAQREGKSRAEIDRMTKKFEAELKPKKDAVEKLDREVKAKVLELDQEMSGKLKTRIETAVRDVARARGYAVVVDKQIVLFGGEDITDEVIKKLNK